MLLRIEFLVNSDWSRKESDEFGRILHEDLPEDQAIVSFQEELRKSIDLVFVDVSFDQQKTKSVFWVSSQELSKWRSKRTSRLHHEGLLCLENESQETLNKPQTRS